jgi:hypothetical protein
VIVAYALAHDLTIVMTYHDEGESGLKLENRLGLVRLLEDVVRSCRLNKIAGCASPGQQQGAAGIPIRGKGGRASFHGPASRHK